MILCYAIHLYGDFNKPGFVKFFIKFEQVCAYARYVHNHESSFNGTDTISKRAKIEPFYISLADSILSNQRTYGIYGKYIRPLRDMGIVNDSEFHSTMQKALSKSDEHAIRSLSIRLMDNDNSRVVVNKEDLIPFANLLKTVIPEEKTIYQDYILKTNDLEHPQNNLFEVVSSNPDFSKADFNLHHLISTILSAQQTNDDLKRALINIDNTDKVLHPLNVIFTNLLSRSYWTYQEVESDELFNQLPRSVPFDFQDEQLREINQFLELSTIDLIRAVVKRNSDICKARGNSAWIEEDKQGFRVLYGENGKRITNVDNELQYEFPYFLNNYLNLYRQIESV